MIQHCPKKIGVIGSGQLARLMALEGIRMGHKFYFWVTHDDSAVQNLGVSVSPSSMSLKDFCDGVDITVIDYEHIPQHEIEIFEQFSPYTDGAKLLRNTQDRLLEKKLQEALGLPMVPYVQIDNASCLSQAKERLELPLILKKRTQGYDGKGQYIIKDAATFEDILNAAQDDLGASSHTTLAVLQRSEQPFNKATENPSIDLTGYIAEKWIPFDAEYSLVSVRGHNGEFTSYDLTHNTHKNGLLRRSENIENQALQKKAHEINHRISEHFQYVGVFAVEYFYYKNELFINEISPRVHNSGHWTSDGTQCSQFENHLRACLGMPLGATESHSNISMINIIGDDLVYEKHLENKAAKLYLYNKTTKPNRKLGHINCAKKAKE